jgi:hypothetical protein
MPATIEPVRLRDEQVMPTSHILASAFYDDPMTVYVEPDEARRDRILPGFFSTGVLIGHRLGEVYTTAGDVHAAADLMPCLLRSAWHRRAGGGYDAQCHPLLDHAPAPARLIHAGRPSEW